MSDYLCKELIVEIFTRLPPQSLIRFRSLSKSLCSCISNPDFIRMHTFRSPQKILFIHLNKNTEAFFHTIHGEDRLPFCPKGGYIDITTVPCPCDSTFLTVGSCNGMICFQNRVKRTCLILWNPSIRRKISLPECPQRSRPHFDLEGFGFGFDATSDDYKIVWMSSAKEPSFLYTVKTGTWCEIASPKPLCDYVDYQAYLFNGVFHWLVESEEKNLTEFIQTFNLSTHVFGMILLPALTWHWTIRVLTTIESSLALISYGKRIHETWIQVKRDSSWSVVFKLNISELYIQRALQLQPQPNINGDLLLGGFWKERWQELHVYNRKTGVLSRLADFNVASRLIGFRQYVETLHLLDMEDTAYEPTQQ